MTNKNNSGRETVSVRINPQLWKEARIYAIKNDKSVADLVEDALKKEIKNKKSD